MAGVLGKKNSAPSSSFTMPEDEALVKALLKISKSANIGSDQKGNSFSKAVNEFSSTEPGFS